MEKRKKPEPPLTDPPRRCAWVGTDELMIAYHDAEWGGPPDDDGRHFEFLTLESAQAGLSWSIVLKKRENYRKAFANFDARKVAAFTERDVKRLIGDPGLIRNEAKIRAAITNASLFLDARREFGSFETYLLSFTGGRPLIRRRRSMKSIPASSPESRALARDMKKRGFKFTGEVVMYSHLQAAGIINDHTTDCFRYEPVSALLRARGAK